MAGIKTQKPLPPEPEASKLRLVPPVAETMPPLEIRYETAFKKLQQAGIRIRQLEKQIEQLQEENEILSHPQVPSWVKLSLPKHRRKKPGPKLGHKAYVRTVPEHVDQEIKFLTDHCPKCQTDDLPPPSSWHSHTQVDIPDIQKVQITQFYVGYSYCRQCHTLVSLPPEKRTGMLPYSKYGPRLHALITFWKYALGMSLKKIQMQLQEQFDLKLSRGQLSEMIAHSAEKLEEIYIDLRAVLRRQHHLYADETGWRNDGQDAWLWSFSNEQFSYYRIEESRGHKVVRRTLGNRFSGILISDFYSTYNKIKCVKQKCWIHLLRTNRIIKADYPRNSEVKLFHESLKRLYYRGIHLQERFSRGMNIEKGLLRLKASTEKFYRHIYTHPDLRKLSKRIKRHRNSLYTFITNNIDASNNAAEREIRPAVLIRKTQFGNRSQRGAHAQEILMSVIRTCFKQNINYLDLAAQYLTRSLHGS